jgi:hypothetical protein
MAVWLAPYLCSVGPPSFRFCLRSTLFHAICLEVSPMARRRRRKFLALGNVCRNGGMACAPSAAVCRPVGGCPQDDTGGRTRGLPPGRYGRADAGAAQFSFLFVVHFVSRDILGSKSNGAPQAKNIFGPWKCMSEWRYGLRPVCRRLPPSRGLPPGRCGRADAGAAPRTIREGGRGGCPVFACVCGPLCFTRYAWE